MGRGLLFLTLWLILSGCGSGAVVFAPTPLPPDLSPLRYEHPGGTFALNVPRNWSVYTQNTAVLASASFSIPDGINPALTAAVINLGRPIAPTELGDLMNDYQTLHRPDLSSYVEQDRQAMGDGSWRLTGVRTLPGGVREQVNTFIEQSGTMIGVLDVVIPPDAVRQVELQNAINTFTINTDVPLQPADLSTFSFVRRSPLEVVNVSSWANPQGVFFVTGELANFSGEPVSEIPVTAQVLSVDGRVLVEASDLVMGYSTPPGGFAPFSLRFGQGRPPEAHNYRVAIGSAQVPPRRTSGQLTWTDASTFTAENHLLITGVVTNEGAESAGRLMAVVTVFDAQQNVVGAWFTELGITELRAGENAPFEVRVMEIGGEAQNYIIEIQGLAE